MKLSKSLNVFGWGVYCAVSWTWCIGMFLPVIMLAQFGWAGFWVFAIPNVIGCGAFGYVVANRESSRRMIDRHGVAATWFSVVTIAYHMFFIAWTISRSFDRPSIPSLADATSITPADWAFMLPLAGVFGLSLIAWAVSRLPDRALVGAACIVYVISFTVFSFLLQVDAGDIAGLHSTRELAFVAPVIVFGFALCPYLDLTFHRALQHTPSRSSFVVFGIAFAPMILLTALLTSATMMPWLVWAVLAHYAAQMVLTMSFHYREIAQQTSIPCPKRKAAMMALPTGVGIMYLLIVTTFELRDAGQATYLRFLGCYGLVFPLYVWVFMTTFGVHMSRPNLLRFVAAVALCAPLYELGFIHEKYVWLLIPIGAFALWPIARILQISRQTAAHSED